MKFALFVVHIKRKKDGYNTCRLCIKAAFYVDF